VVARGHAEAHAPGVSVDRAGLRELSPTSGKVGRRRPTGTGAAGAPAQSDSAIARRYHSWNCCMPSSIGLW
jgi:hypothetical protein